MKTLILFLFCLLILVSCCRTCEDKIVLQNFSHQGTIVTVWNGHYAWEVYLAEKGSFFDKEEFKELYLDVRSESGKVYHLLAGDRLNFWDDEKKPDWVN